MIQPDFETRMAQATWAFTWTTIIVLGILGLYVWRTFP